MKYVIPSFMNMYHICPRELWLHANQINMEHTSELVFEGKLIHEYSYAKRNSKYVELDLGIAKIDFYDSKNRVVHETKKSNKVEEAHIQQVKYYLYLLHQLGINATAVIEYPTLRETKKIILLEEDIQLILQWIKEINLILSSPKCPPTLPNRNMCRSCSYFEFCYT
ncbi:MAG: CRISPR-associated protein Cas4 [Candidatus Gracilibacteria bacterium]|nr:CRISPR-associated protein Cas4 [Candidatus Gracilibacteria bacterium]